MRNGNGSKANESVTFRLGKDMLEALRLESQQKRINLNTLAGQVFDQYVGWHMKAAEAGMVSFPKELLTLIMDKLKEEDVVKIARYIGDQRSKEIIMMLRQQFDLVSVVDVLEFWLKALGIPYNLQTSSSEYRYVLQHDMGRKWSICIKEAWKVIFENVGVKKTEFEISDNSILVKIAISKE